MIFNLLNPLFNEENNWTISYWVCEVYDEYAVVRNNIENKFERAFYTKNDETDSLTIDKMEDCWFVDVNEEEKAAIEAVGAKYSYTEIDEKLNSIESLNETISTMTAAAEAATASIEQMTSSIATLTEENATLKSDNENFGIKITELEEANSTLNTEIGELKTSAEAAQSNYSALQTSFEELTAERDALAAYKKSVLDEQKKGIIASYVDSLSSEVIEEYTNSLDNYTLEELDMKLTYEVKKANPTMFSKQANPEPTYVPKDFGNNFTINEILSKYEKH
jgi:chromosome segregation ATPase